MKNAGMMKVLDGESYAFVLPVNTLGFALNNGRIAGEQAANYVKSGTQ